MNKTVTMLLFAGMVAGCVSSISQPEQTISKFNPAPVQPAPRTVTNSTPSPETSGPIIPNVDYPRILNGQIQGSFNIDGALKDHRVVCKKAGGVWDYDDNRCGFQRNTNHTGRLDVSFGTETYVLDKGYVGPVNYVEIVEGNKVAFLYSSISSAHRNKWLEYLYERYGEPFFYYQNDEKTYSRRKWEFDNGVVYISDWKITPVAPDVNRHQLVGPQLDTPATNYLLKISYVKENNNPECKIGILESQYTKPLYMFIYIDGVMVGIRSPINATVSCGVHNVILEKFQVDGGEKKHELVETTHFAPAIVTVDFE